jgi:acyl-CoA thioesterase I
MDSPCLLIDYSDAPPIQNDKLGSSLNIYGYSLSELFTLSSGAFMSILFISSLFGCEPGTGLLAVGDSVFDYNTENGESIPEVAASKLGIAVQNNAIGGSHLSSNNGESITETYEPGDWSWVLVDGGANDLNDECSCGDCEVLLDELISPDSTGGIMSEFVDQIQGDGHPVALMGYYMLPEGAEYGFANCVDTIIELNSRYTALAEQVEGVYYIDAGEVITPDQSELYDTDNVHPSVEGSRVLGEFIAEQILSFE